VENSTLIHAVTRLCPTNKIVTECEAETGMIPNLDDIPPVGCFAIRFLDKLDRKDFKLSPANQAGVFMGYATLQHVFGAVIQVGSNAYVTARHNVSYVLHHFLHSNNSHSSNAELSWLHTLLAGSQNKKGSVSFNKSASEIEDVSLYCAESFVERVETHEIFVNDNQTSDKGSEINQEVQIALQQLVIPVRETRATAKSKADTEDASFLSLSSLHSPDSNLVEQNQKIDISRPKHAASTDVIVAPKFTEGELRANRTLLAARILVRNFGKLGNFEGVVSSYDAVHEEYRIDFSADNTYELLSFDDVLTLLPNA